MASCALILALILPAALPQPAKADAFENEVLAELNRARAHPRTYAHELRRRSEVVRAGYGGPDDPEAVRDAIGFLERQAPLPPLRPDGRIAAAALDHVRLQGPRGGVGHGRPGSLGRRMQDHGVWAGLEAEGISYGQPTPDAVVRQLIIDSGVPGRGHRKDVFDHAYQTAGVACGPHAIYGEMCVIDYAGAIVRR
jgi:hypothetical protein